MQEQLSDGEVNTQGDQLQDLVARLNSANAQKTAQTKLIQNKLNTLNALLDDTLVTDNTRIIELKQENHILNTLNKQYEQTLHVIMEKFREKTQTIQTEKLTLQKQYNAQLEIERSKYQDLSSKHSEIQSQLEASLLTMRKALDADADDDEDLRMNLSALRMENESLRELLNISSSSTEQ